MNDMKHEIYISRDKKKLGHIEATHYIKKAVKMTLEAEKIPLPCLISVMLTDDEGIHEINKEFRDVDRATDVLSFPLNELEPGNFKEELCEKDFETGAAALGDMMISIPRCEAQGKEYGHGFKREIMYLAVHSTLHLLGYDHIDEGPMKAQMRKREKAIMGDD